MQSCFKIKNLYYNVTRTTTVNVRENNIRDIYNIGKDKLKILTNIIVYNKNERPNNRKRSKKGLSQLL